SCWNRPNEPRAAGSGGPRLGDVAALPLPFAQFVAAHSGVAVLADIANVDLGVHEPVPLLQQQLCIPRFWRPAGRGHAVGRAFPRTTRIVDVVSRGDVGAQSRASFRHAFATLGVGSVAAVDEHDPRVAWHAAGGVAGDPALSLLDLRDGASAG